jgi:hypothetical protein
VTPFARSSPAPRGTLVIAHPEREAQRVLQRLVGPTRWPVELVENLDALVAAVDANAIAIVDAELARKRPDLRSLPALAWIAVPGQATAAVATTAAGTVGALLEAGWTHVSVHPMPLLAEELLATLSKLIRGDVFGLEKYLGWAAEVHSYPLEDAGDRGALVAAVSRDILAAGLPERLGQLAGVIADELLTNALYTAPVDADGRRGRVREARDQRRPLAGRDAVTLRWGTDARYLALEVRDRWGSLDEAAIGPRLAGGAGKAPEGGGGGMGMLLVYACCTQLVLGTVPSALTEVIALLDVRFGTSELTSGTSFHAFRGTPQAL